MPKFKSTNLKGVAAVMLGEIIENDKDAFLMMCCERAFKMTLTDHDYSKLKDITLEHIGPSNITEDDIMFNVTAKIEEEVAEEDDNGLMSLDALQWLKSVNYGDKNHEERMALIKAARILYPNTDSDDDELDMTRRFFATLGMA